MYIIFFFVIIVQKKNKRLHLVLCELQIIRSNKHSLIIFHKKSSISTINGSTALTYPYVLQGIFFYTLLMLSQYGTIVIACSNSSCKCCV